MDIHIFDIFPIILFFISFFGLITTVNIVKSIILTVLMQTAVIMFWLGLAARLGRVPPIFGYYADIADLNEVADPLPQALMLTAIIIGIAVTAINITLLNSLFRKYRTVKWDEMTEAALEDEQPDVG